MKPGDFEAADSAFTRARGLMFRLRLGRPLLFTFPKEARVECAIHAFFVFFPFDAVYLDGRKKVVDVRHRILPFTPLVVPRKPAKYLIEAPAGWAKAKKICIGKALRL